MRSLSLHLVWCPNYRRWVLGGRIACRLDELLGQIAAAHGWLIVANEMTPDHVHLVVRVSPAGAPVSVARVFKGRTTRILRQEFQPLRNDAKVLWSPSFFACIAGPASRTTAVLAS